MYENAQRRNEDKVKQKRDVKIKMAEKASQKANKKGEVRSAVMPKTGEEQLRRR